MLPKVGALLFVCVCLLGCGSGVSTVGFTPEIPVPDGFPRQLLSFAGPSAAFGLDGKAWDAYGIGAPSNTVLINGNYWMCVAGYPSAGFTSQSIGCWYGNDLNHLQPYAQNPIVTNNQTGSFACFESPSLNIDTAGIVHVVYFETAAGTACDSFGGGSNGEVHGLVSTFPAGLSAVSATPLISQASALNFLYRATILEIDGICYDYANAGVGSPNQFVIVTYKTGGTCAATESTAANWKFNRVEVYNTPGTWEGTNELQDPQVWKLPSGLWAMIFGAGATGKGGYATTTDPVHGTWSKLDSNPFYQPGYLWLPRITQDASGQYWMWGNFNNTPQMNLWMADGH